jgi:hypothetical protein
MKAFVFLGAVVLFFSPGRTFGDIAPTTYVGSAIVPVRAPGIRMVRATVDIAWGIPCTLTADFVMENTTAKPVEVLLGFPLNLPDALVKKDVLGFSMRFDDVPARPDEITEVGKPRINTPADTTWYRCRHTFPPGPTRVTVETKLPASLVYRTQNHERLIYCIETGASWEGTIGAEEVTIHFPGPVTADQIVRATPGDYVVSGDTVRWEFKDFKPKGDDHDIRIEYLRPPGHSNREYGYY